MPVKTFSVKPVNATKKVYPADTPIFDRGNVALDLPDRLFTNTFTITGSASKLIGNLIKNSSRRFSYFAFFLKPIFGDALVIKDTAEIALQNTTTTEQPTTSVPEYEFNFTFPMDNSIETTITPIAANQEEKDNDV